MKSFKRVEKFNDSEFDLISQTKCLQLRQREEKRREEEMIEFLFTV